MPAGSSSIRRQLPSLISLRFVGRTLQHSSEAGQWHLSATNALLLDSRSKPGCRASDHRSSDLSIFHHLWKKSSHCGGACKLCGSPAGDHDLLTPLEEAQQRPASTIETIWFFLRIPHRVKKQHDVPSYLYVDDNDEGPSCDVACARTTTFPPLFPPVDPPAYIHRTPRPPAEKQEIKKVEKLRADFEQNLVSQPLSFLLPWLSSRTFWFWILFPRTVPYAKYYVYRNSFDPFPLPLLCCAYCC